VHEENQGICKTLNEALSYAKGTYFQMIACDDLFLPEKTDIQVNYLQENNEPAMVYTDAHLIKSDSTPHYGWFIQRHRNFAELPSCNIYEELLKNNFIPAMSTMTRTQAIRKLGGWDENLVYEDYDFWLRLAKDHTISVIDKPLVKYRLHGNNFHTNIKFEEQKFQIYLKHKDNQLGQKKLQSTFFSLYKNGLASKEIKKSYIGVFKNYNHTRLIKAGFNYRLYKQLISFF
jgi:glycosyltransferase involved in cell wall biosynthesis